MRLAVELNRTWVEPCIRNGCLEPCRCDALPDMPTEYDPAATPAPDGSNPGAGLYPRTGFDCKQNFDPGVVATAYPLSAFIDVPQLAAREGVAVVSYRAWCADYRVRNAGAFDPKAKRWTEPAVPSCYGGTHDTTGCVNQAGGPPDMLEPGFQFGDFVFPKGGVYRRNEPDFTPLKTDTNRNLFLYNYHRGPFRTLMETDPVGGMTLPFARIQIDAVDAFIAERFGTGGYVAYHWRSGVSVKSEDFERCARDLLGATPAALLPGPGRRSRAMLVTDLPSPSNDVKEGKMWIDDNFLNGTAKAEAARIMVNGGYLKLDAIIPHPSAVDLGVFSVRDFLFALKAQVYATCSGTGSGESQETTALRCKGCNKPRSNLIVGFGWGWWWGIPEGRRFTPPPPPFPAGEVGAGPARGQKGGEAEGV